MGDTLTLTLNQALILFVFIAIGYVLYKIKCVEDSTSKVLSQIVTTIAMPALCFKTFAQNMTQEKLSRSFNYFICGAVLVVIMFAIAMPLGRAFSKAPETANIYRYAVCATNCGYFGYPMINAVFGEQAMADAMTFTIPMNLFIYTIGIYMLDPQKKFSLKRLLDPTLISIAVGIIVGLSGFQMPNVVTNIFTTAADCVSPLSMIMTGIVLAKMPVCKLLSNGKVYIMTLLRLIIFPALVFVGMKLFKIDGDLTFIATAVYAMPCGLNAVVYPEVYGGDSKTGAQVCFISIVGSLITLPLVFSLFRSLL